MFGGQEEKEIDLRDPDLDGDRGRGGGCKWSGSYDKGTLGPEEKKADQGAEGSRKEQDRAGDVGP